MVLVIGILAVTSSSFIVLEAGEISNSMGDRIVLAFYRVLFTSFFSYVFLYRLFKLNPGRSNMHKETRASNIPMWAVVLLSGGSLAFHFSLWFISLDYLPVGISLALTNSAPIFVVILTWLLYHERTTPLQVGGVLMAISGAAILSLESFNDSTVFLNGFLFAFLSAIALAVYLSLAKKGVTEYGLWNYFGKVNFVAAMVLLFWILFIGKNPVSLSTIYYGFLLALIPGIMGHASFQYAMSRVRSAIVSVSTLGEPLLGTLIAWVFLDQILTGAQTIGGLLILFGVYVTSRR